MKGFFSKVFQSQQQMSKHYSSSPNLETLGVITSSRAKGGSSYQKLEQAAFGGLRESIATGPMALWWGNTYSHCRSCLAGRGPGKRSLGFSLLLSSDPARASHWLNITGGQRAWFHWLSPVFRITEQHGEGGEQLQMGKQRSLAHGPASIVPSLSITSFEAMLLLLETIQNNLLNLVTQGGIFQV